MSENGNPTKIDAIKELIFGQNIKENEARFEKIERSIATAKSNSKSSIDQLQAEFKSLLKDQKAEYSAAIKGLEKEIAALKHDKVGNKELKTLLLALAEKL